MWDSLNSINKVRNLEKSEQNKILKEKSIKELLLFFMEETYLNETIKIPSNKIRILQQDSKFKKFRIIDKEYSIEIDLEKKLIKHDCKFWIYQCSSQYKLCKHLGKIFLAIFEDDSKEILKDIILNDWKFEIY